ncbi:MAG: DUF1343 domain-containing protein [Acidobacteriota bacterium]
MKQKKIRYGIDSFVNTNLSVHRNKRVALLSNYSATDSGLNLTIKLLSNCNDLNLTTLLAPEHGLTGKYQAGENVPEYIDRRTGLPVISLYDQTSDISSGLPENIDERMRNFDTSEAGKKIDPDILENIDLIILDIQDIGTRIYTYISTMGYLMEALAGTGKELLILDRPNPITGTRFEGPVLQYPEFFSFVGFYSIPVRHGMTIGELALMFNDKLYSNKVRISIEKTVNWKRDMWLDHFGANWISPSPNMPTLNTAAVYPGMVFLEGTNISEGRGTTTPFEQFGAPWLDGYSLSEELNKKKMSGVIFHETVFRPVFSKYSGTDCSGVKILVSDREKFSPFKTMLQVLSTIEELQPGKLVIYDKYFNKIAGNSTIAAMLLNGEKPEQIIRSYEKDLSEFKKYCKKYYLYS